MRLRSVLGCAFLVLVFFNPGFSKKVPVIFCGSSRNDLYILLSENGFKITRYDSIWVGLNAAPEGAAIFVVSESYPIVSKRNVITAGLLAIVVKKKLKLYVEYPFDFPGVEINNRPIATTLERGVITSDAFGGTLKPMSLLGLNDCHVLRVEVKDPLMVLAKVVGFDKAEYGLANTKSYPLLYRQNNALVAMTKLSGFATGRYGPNESVKQLWTYILEWMTNKKGVRLDHWPSHVSPAYNREDVLPENARINSIRKGIQWFFNGRFFVHPEWEDRWLKYQGNGVAPFGPPVSQDLPNGNGSLGILEGHASTIYYDGSQQYRYWMRADVQGEAAMALAAAGKLLNNKEYNQRAVNLIDFVFSNSNLRADEKSDKNSPAFGLIGWATTHPGVFYGDDNARVILGVIAASAYLDNHTWDKALVEAIMGNFRTTSLQGFSGERVEEKDLLKNGWKHYWERDFIHVSPHFESWMWACYLWLYHKTGYEPLLTKTKKAIQTTMAAYPEKWLWGSSLQTQRARMILPLAWLVRIEDTEEHRKWLDLVAEDLLKNQVKNGAIREEIGKGPGRFKPLNSNEDYGTDESSLIFSNGDPVADMLYTCNFALFSLNEAAHATGDKKYQSAVNRLSDFLIRIQVNSVVHKDLDGAWFRAFDYDRWDYWASNADAGWGAWSTLTGWIQSWIVATQVQIAEDESYWDLTRECSVEDHMSKTIEVMFSPHQR